MNVGAILKHVRTSYRSSVASIADLGDGLALVTLEDGRQLEATLKGGKVECYEVEQDG